MSTFFQQLINGVSLGAIYALIALGYTMVYGVLKFINFAHGDVFMIGAYVGFYVGPWVMRIFGAESLVGGLVVMLIAMIVCGLLGVVLEQLAYRPLRNRPRLTVLITAIGVSLFLEYTGQLVFSANPQAFPRDLIPNQTVLDIGGVTIDAKQLIVLGTALGLMVVLRLIVLKTRLGMAMRAVSFNQAAASLMGINTNFVISFTFGLGSALAGAASILFALTYPTINPLMGILPGLKAFVAAVLGGIGNIPGALLGGFLLGTTETMVAGYLSSTYRDAIAFAVLILILLFRPGGLLGKNEIEKV